MFLVPRQERLAANIDTLEKTLVFAWLRIKRSFRGIAAIAGTDERPPVPATPSNTTNNRLYRLHINSTNPISPRAEIIGALRYDMVAAYWKGGDIFSTVKPFNDANIEPLLPTTVVTPSENPLLPPEPEWVTTTERLFGWAASQLFKRALVLAAPDLIHLINEDDRTPDPRLVIRASLPLNLPKYVDTGNLLNCLTELDVVPEPEQSGSGSDFGNNFLVRN